MSAHMLSAVYQYSHRELAARLWVYCGIQDTHDLALMLARRDCTDARLGKSDVKIKDDTITVRLYEDL